VRRTINFKIQWYNKNNGQSAPFYISIGLGQIDVEILQAIKGQLGLITVAQLSILENLKEVEAAYSDLLKVIAPDIVAPLSSRKKSKKIKLF